MNSVKVYSETFPAIFSGRLREATAPFSHVFTPQALGSLPVSGPLIFCNPNPFHPPNSFLPLVLAVLCPPRDIMSTKIAILKALSRFSLPLVFRIYAIIALSNQGGLL